METSLFMDKRSQSVRLPVAMRFADNVKKINIRKVGQDRVLSPLSQTWDSFFLQTDRVSEDFMQTRETPQQADREDLQC